MRSTFFPVVCLIIILFQTFHFIIGDDGKQLDKFSHKRLQMIIPINLIICSYSDKDFPSKVDPNILQFPWIWDAIFDPNKALVSLTSINRGDMSSSSYSVLM